MLRPFQTGAYCSIPGQKVVRRGVAFTWVWKKNQMVRSKTGPEIGWYGKVNQKLERYEQKNRSSLGPLSGHV